MLPVLGEDPDTGDAALDRHANFRAHGDLCTRGRI